MSDRASSGAGVRLLVVEPDGGCPLDRLGEWLRAELEGVEVLTCRPWAGDPVPSRPRDADGIVVLGGQMGALDDDLHPWLADVRALLAAAVEDAVPTLGICLGAQLLAAATGGTVERGAHGREAGVVDVGWRAEAADDPLVGGLGAYPGPSMHQDAVTALPPRALWLGEGGAYAHQAFRVGAAAWGVQFHPEVSVPVFSAWARMDLPDPAQAAAAAHELAVRDGEVADAGRSLAARFATLVCRSGGRVRA